MAIQRNDDEIAYSLIKYQDTNEIHVFKGKFTTDNCTANDESICKKLNRKKEEILIVEKCLNEDEVRLKAAHEGRSVCGTCVSDLYTTY